MRTSLFALAAVLAIPTFATLADASPFTDVTLGLAGPNGLNLTVFATGGTFQSTNPTTTTNGNVGWANGVTQSGTSDGTVTGTVYYQNASSLTGIGNFNHGGTFTQTSLTQAVSDVQTAATKAKALTPDQIFNSDIGSTAVTINPSGVDTVVQINGKISISNSSKSLTINGSANDFFIINVTGDITLTNGSITTTGGIPASHILFNLTGTNANLTTQTSTSEVGTFLLPFPGDQITTHGNNLNGSLIGYNVSMTSSTNVINGIFTPEPASLAVLGIGAAGMLGRRRRA